MSGLIEKRDEFAQKLQSMIDIRDAAIDGEIEAKVNEFRNNLIKEAEPKRIKTEDMLKLEKMIEALNEVIDFESREQSPEALKIEVKEEDIIPVEETNIVPEEAKAVETVEVIEAVPTITQSGVSIFCTPERG